MDENKNVILRESGKMIARLQLLSTFFSDETVYSIFIRTQVIQRLFENNPELDINKLELFHLQYTETVIELLRKIKKSNENTVEITLDEIACNEELIEKLNHTLRTAGNYTQEKNAHAIAINTALHKLYNNLSGYSAEPPFSKEIQAFGEKNAKEFYPEISSLLFDELIVFDPVEVYKNGYGIIEKKLLGWQCKYDFQNSFIGGLKDNERLLEIFKLEKSDDYFLFYPARRFFLDIAVEKIKDIDFTIPLSQEEKLVKELTQKNATYKNNLNSSKTNIPAPVKALLQEYYAKIVSLDFTNDEFDIEANILKTMLNTK